MAKPKPNRVRVWRAERRLTQLSLSRKCRISVTRISFIENAIKPASPAERGRLAKALKVTVADLFPLDVEASTPPIATQEAVPA